MLKIVNPIHLEYGLLKLYFFPRSSYQKKKQFLEARIAVARDRKKIKENRMCEHPCDWLRRDFLNFIL